MRRVRFEVRGAVQGVGFRPFVWRLAHALSLAGWVRNDIAGVFIELEGEDGALAAFRRELDSAPPPLARIREVIESSTEVTKESGFHIRPSEDTGARTTLVLPDVATCPACLAEVLDPKDRRHLYPFANCTDCGPRFTIVTDLPYDRPKTTMAAFTLCADVPRRVRRPARPPLPRAAHRVPGVRAVPRSVVARRRGARAESTRRSSPPPPRSEEATSSP